MSKPEQTSERRRILRNPFGFDEALRRIETVVESIGLTLDRDVQIDSACAPPTDPCPHTGNVSCECQVAVLIIGGARRRLNLVLHSTDHQTELQFSGEEQPLEIALLGMLEWRLEAHNTAMAAQA